MKKLRILSFLFVILISFGFAQKYQILGQDEGDGELISPRQIKEGPDGNFYIYDSQDAYIKVFSSDGKFLIVESSKFSLSASCN